MINLKDSALLKTEAYIDGGWVAAGSGNSFAVTNPVDGSEIARVPDLREAETRRAIDAANRALPAWRWRQVSCCTESPNL